MILCMRRAHRVKSRSQLIRFRRWPRFRNRDVHKFPGFSRRFLSSCRGLKLGHPKRRIVAEFGKETEVRWLIKVQLLPNYATWSNIIRGMKFRSIVC